MRKRRKLTYQEQLNVILKYEVELCFTDAEEKGEYHRIDAFPHALCAANGGTWETVCYKQKRDKSYALEQILYQVRERNKK